MQVIVLLEGTTGKVVSNFKVQHMSSKHENDKLYYSKHENYKLHYHIKS